MPGREAGQATVEWTAIVLVVALALGSVAYAVVRSPLRGLGEAIVDAFVCTVGDGCPDALEDAYGVRVATLVRRYAPNIVYERSSAQLPIDFRRCRRVACANGPEEPVRTDQSDVGLRVTAFTRVVDRRQRGGRLYLQYWLYFPESFSGGVGRKLGPLADRWPGYHADDWEGYQVRVGPGEELAARVTAHGRYTNFNDGQGWGPWTSWYRVSGGSHAGHLVARPPPERTTPSSALSLVPLEDLGSTDLYSFDVTPPWRKGVYEDPESDAS